MDDEIKNLTQVWMYELQKISGGNGADRKQGKA
jgi:hypothetical protein